MGQNIFDELRKELENGNLTKEQKARLIQKAGEEYNKQIDRELNWYLTKQYAGAALEIGSVALPLSATKTVGSFATKVAMPMLEKKIGKKLAKDITTSAISGAIGSSIYGIGRGLMKDKNILKTSLEDAVFGLGTGALVGTGSANLQRMLHGNKLKNYGDIDALAPELRKQYGKDVKRFYKDYIQGIVLNKDGNINFTRPAIQEILRWNPKHGQNLLNLEKDLLHSKRLDNIPNKKPETKTHTKHFNVYQGNLGKHLIEEFNSGDRRYYTIVDTLENIPQSTNLAIPKSANNILSDYLQKCNPAEWLNSQITTSVVDATHQYDQKIVDALNDFYIQAQEDAVPGVLKGGVSEYASPNLETYNNKKIYTMEEFENMSAEDYEQNKKEIHEQIGKIGLPTEEEVKSLKQETQKVDTDNQNGHWITKNGHHIFIENEK